MADQYYVKVNFEWGTDDNGTLTAKNSGETVWVSMDKMDSVALQNMAVVPSFCDMFTKAAALGLDPEKNTPPGRVK